MSKPSKLQTPDANQETNQNTKNGIPQRSRREMLDHLRKAAVAVPIATALAIKPGAAFGEA